MPQPTIKQMRNRMLSAHEHILRRVSAGLPIASAATPMWEIRGLLKAARTLRRWGALDSNGEITTTGRALLEPTP